MQKKHKLQNENYDWYPIGIESLDIHLFKLIKENEYIPNEKTYPIRRNIAYSIQYIEFLNKIRTDVHMTTVLLTQNIKSILVHGTTIIEAIFFFLVESKGFSNSTNWKKLKNLNTSEYELENKKFKNEVIIFEKSDSEIKTSMTFDQMAKKIETKKLLGEDYENYSRINALRKLRNKIHIHDAQHNFDTDWNNFNYKELVLICDVLHSIITSDLFKGSEIMNKFNFLKIENNSSKEM
jgi:hypothetical protein